MFTGDEFADGGSFIAKTLRQKKIKASFFFTGKFYRNQALRKTIKDLIADGHYLGSHSDQHLLYCDWVKRDSLLVDHTAFTRDLRQGYRELKKFGIAENHAKYFLPPYEWYNDTIAKWTREMGLQLINYSPGTLSNADYTTPDMKNYRSGDTIFESIKKYEETHAEGLNGFILLLHIGTSPDRTDKFYKRLPELFAWLQSKRYEMVRVDQLLKD